MKALFLQTGLAACLVVTATGSIGRIATSAAVFPGDDKAILHVLNRIGFGPRDGDVERVRAVGLQSYIDQQLHPERIADAALAQRLAGLTTLGLSSREIAEQYELPAIAARLQQQKNGETGAGRPPDSLGDANGGPPPMPDPVQNAVQQRANRVLIELGQQKVLRAVYSDRQLEEVLTDFWFNHFNVDARKGADRFLLTEYEREAIRPNVLGTFRDLLDATAKSPAMLFYLDNWMSADANGPHAQMPMPVFGRGGFGLGPFNRPGFPPAPPRLQAQGKNAPKGLNENYGRELMELHTLGVDGGYTQKDVTEVARSFTGWTIQNPRMGGGFRFEPRLHDVGQKVVLGHVIRAGRGIEDGEQVLDILASHPSTAHFVATKLARRFVGDTPPPALVERAARRFRETGGDLREVTRTILTSPEFLSPDAFQTKIKTPFEFVASALRAVNADVQNAMPIVRAVQQLGMPLYQCQPPTGYKDTADAWVNTGALVNRMNFSLQLASNRLPGTLVVGPPSSISSLTVDLSESTRATIGKATSAPEMVALTLGSPEFQRR